MKFKSIYALILLVVTALILSWALPELVKVGTSTSPDYPFVYYSSLRQEFVTRQQVNNKPVFKDLSGNSYTLQQYDSITPLLNYRQLMLSGNMPDSILGVPMETKMLRSRSWVWRYNPKDLHKPLLGLYIMYESMSGRANLESPEDVFRFDDRIEFITKRTNKVNVSKSNLFQKKLEKEGFVFPSLNVWGNLSNRKPYDEGYFVLDSKRQLFHMKMVNGRPYVKDTKAGKDVNIAWFSILEVPDKSIYGFVVSRDGHLYTLGGDGYGLTKFDIPAIDIHQNSVMVMTNLFYSMTNVIASDSTTYHVLEAQTLKKHDEPYVIRAKTDRWDVAAGWLFPVYTSLSDNNTKYLTPEINVTSGKAFLISTVLALLFVFTVSRKRKPVMRVANLLLVVLFGIPGLLASLLIKK